MKDKTTLLGFTLFKDVLKGFNRFSDTNTKEIKEVSLNKLKNVPKSFYYSYKSLNEDEWRAYIQNDLINKEMIELASDYFPWRLFCRITPNIELLVYFNKRIFWDALQYNVSITKEDKNRLIFTYNSERQPI